MTGSAQGPGEGHDRIGSAAEEAAKLFGALSGWASDLGDSVHGHLDTGAAECTYCPICRTVHVLREASPEIRSHLAGAAASLMQAAAGLLAAAAASSAPARDRSAGVERIDLDIDLDSDPDRDPDSDPAGEDPLDSDRPEGDQ